MEWVIASIMVGTYGVVSFYVGYRKGAKRVLNEWKDWLNDGHLEE